jgi:hypothetical protein
MFSSTLTSNITKRKGIFLDRSALAKSLSLTINTLLLVHFFYYPEVELICVAVANWTKFGKNRRLLRMSFQNQQHQPTAEITIVCDKNIRHLSGRKLNRQEACWRDKLTRHCQNSRIEDVVFERNALPRLPVSIAHEKRLIHGS